VASPWDALSDESRQEKCSYFLVEPPPGPRKAPLASLGRASVRDTGGQVGALTTFANGTGSLEGEGRTPALPVCFLIQEPLRFEFPPHPVTPPLSWLLLGLGSLGGEGLERVGTDAHSKQNTTDR
jgi:hypothetical protein